MSPLLRPSLVVEATMCPLLRVSSPSACLPTLADAVAARCAAQLETGLAAAVPSPLHLRAAGCPAEGRVVRQSLRAGCGEKSRQGQPLLPAGPGEGPGSQPGATLNLL